MAFRARYVGCVVAIAFVCSAASAASVYEWERMDGPYGGSVSGLRRGHNGEVFVEANRETYVLSEEARVWRPAEPLPSTRYQIDDQGSWYWLDIRGIDYEAWVMRSDDEGETWQRVLRFRGDFWYGPLIVADDHIYVNTPSGRQGASIWGGGLKVSADQGRSWRQATRDSVGYFLVEDAAVFAVTGGGLSVSDDHGLNWSLIADDGWLEHVTSVARHDGALYAAATGKYGALGDQGLYRSDDDGATWTRLGGNDGELGVLDLLASDEGLYATTPGAGVLFSIDGITWIPVNHGLPADSTQLEVLDDAVYADGRRSTNGGITWEPPSRTVPHPDTPRLHSARISHGSTHFILLGDRGGLWSSPDGGREWRLAAEGVDDRWFEFLTAEAERLFIVADQNTYSSVDGGDALQRVGDESGLPYRTSTVAWVGPDLFLGTTEGDVLRSTDGGATWTADARIPDGTGITGFATVDGTIFAAADRGVFTRRESRRGSTSWRPTDVPPESVAAVTAHDGVVYAAAGRRVYRSHDLGGSWHITGDTPTAGPIESLGAGASTLYAGTRGAFYRMALPTQPDTPPAFDILSRAHRILKPGATSVNVRVDMAEHVGPWQWRLDQPFPTEGPAGGVEASGADTTTVYALTPGRVHRIYVTPTTDDGAVAYPGTQRYVTVFAQSDAWETDRDLSQTRLAYWSQSRLTLSRPDGQVLSELGIRTGSLASALPPVWAPDGVRLLVREQYAARMTVIDAVAGTQSLLSDAVLGTPRAWSPGGGQFAFSSYDTTPDRATGIYVTPVSGGATRRIASPADYHGRLAWAADAKHIAYMREGEAWIAPVAGGPPLPMHIPSTPDFSPDGTRLAYVLDGNVYVSNVDGSNPTQLTDLPLIAYDPSWAPDASRIVFWVRQANSLVSSGIYTVGADGQDLSGVAEHGAHPSWSPFPNPPSAPSIRVVAPAPGRTVSLAPGSHAAPVRVDVQRHTAGWNWRLDKPFPVTGPAGGAHISDGAEVVVRDFAPAAEHVIYVALVDEHGDMLMPPAVDATTFLAPPVDAVAAAAAAARVAYVSTDEELHILRADGSNRATVQPDTAIDDMGPARWSRSGRAVFAAWTDGDGHGGTPGRRLFVTDASTGVARLTGSAIGVSHPDWAPDGNRIVYAVGASIETANSDDGSNRREIASGGELSRPRYSPDGNQIAYLDSDWRHTTLHAADATGGDRHAVAPAFTQVETFVWDPLGARLAIGMPGVIYVLDSTHAEPTAVRAGTLMSWSPDGRWIAYVDPDGGFSLHNVHTGHSRNLLKPDYRRFVVDTAWAPNSARVACSVGTHPGSSSGVLRILPIKPGDDEVPLTGLRAAVSVSWPGYTVSPPSKLSIVRPHAGAVFGATTTSVGISVESGALWRWRRNGYFPASGEAGGSPGSDEQVTSGGLSPGRVYTIRVAAVDDHGDLIYPRDVTSVTFTVTIPADANADGIVDVRDLTYVAANLGRGGDFESGEPDVDGSGAVRIEDLMLVAAHFGERIAPHAAAAPSLPTSDSAGSLDEWVRRAEGVSAHTRELQTGLATLRRLLASVAPALTALHPNYPNPFNPETWIPFDLSTTSVVTITLYDMRGRQVRRLELGALPPGRYRDKARAGRWDGRNDVGEAVGSGVYIAELHAGSHVERRRVVILK